MKRQELGGRDRQSNVPESKKGKNKKGIEKAKERGDCARRKK